jgi:hypothetical protein
MMRAAAQALGFALLRGDAVAGSAAVAISAAESAPPVGGGGVARLCVAARTMFSIAVRRRSIICSSGAVVAGRLGAGTVFAWGGGVGCGIGTVFAVAEVGGGRLPVGLL